MASAHEDISNDPFLSQPLLSTKQCVFVVVCLSFFLSMHFFSIRLYSVSFIGPDIIVVL